MQRQLQRLQAVRFTNSLENLLLVDHTDSTELRVIESTLWTRTALKMFLIYMRIVPLQSLMRKSDILHCSVYSP